MLVYEAFRVAEDIEHRPLGGLLGPLRPTGLHGYAFTVLASCFPGVILFGIPPALVALTGLPFIFVFGKMRDRILEERMLLECGPHRVPWNSRLAELARISTDRPRVLVQIDQLLSDPSAPEEVQRNLLERCVRLRHRPPIATLFRIARSEHARVAVPAIEILSAWRRDAEPILIRLLERREPRVREAAVVALGQAGSVRAIAALTQPSDRRFATRRLRRAVKQSLVRIRQRAGTLAPGALSLAAPSELEGALSSPAVPSGALSEPRR
jgi:hypothetical protein